MISDDVLIAAIAAFFPTVAAVIGIFFGRKKLREIHIELDGRLDALLESTRRIAEAAGAKRGREEERDRQEHEREKDH